MLKKFALLTAIGAVLLLSRVALSQPLFAPPVNLGQKINTVSNETDPFLTTDGKKLFFVRTSNIWFAEWTDTGWTNPQSLGPQINTGPDAETSPSITPDGQKLYFVAGTRQGFYYDIWVSTWDSSLNDWGNPVNLGSPVNTTGAEFSAHLTPDGRRLYFSSDGAGRCGIYVSEWDGSSWSNPVKVSVSSCAIDEYPSITTDSEWLYFDRYLVDSGRSVFVSSRTGSDWGLPYDLRPQLGGGGTPFVTASGDNLFFASTALSGFGGADIWMAQRLSRGDLNMDAQLTATDVILELNKVFLEEPYPAPEPTGDINCDSRFTPADVVFLIQVVFLYKTPGC